MITTESSAANRDEQLRTILRESISRYNHELLEDEERQELRDRIRRLRKRLALS